MPASHVIDFQVHGDDMQFVEVELDPRETVIAEAGAMMYMEDDIVFETKMGDGTTPSQGLLGKLAQVGKRALTGESLFMTHFTNFHTAKNVRYGIDWQPGASQLLGYLVSQATIPEYQVRWKWTPDSVAIWDNRSTQHYAVMDYPPCHRKNLFARPQCPMLIKTGHWVVDHHDLVRQIGVLLQGSKAERQRQCVPIPGA